MTVTVTMKEEPVVGWIPLWAFPSLYSGVDAYRLPSPWELHQWFLAC